MGWSLNLCGYSQRKSPIPGSMGDLINNEKILFRLLKIIYNLSYDDIKHVDVKALGPGSDIIGNLSESGRIAITVTTNDGSQHQFSWFVKVQPQDHENSGLVSDLNLFKNEIEFYHKIAPELKEFVEEFKAYGTEDITFDIPELIHAEVDSDHAIIILEDLVEAGYKQHEDFNENRCLSKENAIIAVRSIAKIHAASYALQLKNNVDLGIIHPHLEESGHLWSHEEMTSRLSIMRDGYCDIVKEVNKPDSRTLVDRVQRTFDSHEKLRMMTERRVSRNHGEGINCLQHGDFNFNNLMFRDEDDGRTSVMIVDWQMTYTGNAGGDLAYLLMSSLNPQMFEMDEQSIKAEYFKMFHQIFLSLIKETKDEVEDMLEQDYHESLPLGFLFSCGNVMNNAQSNREKTALLAYHLCTEAAVKNLI